MQLGQLILHLLFFRFACVLIKIKLHLGVINKFNINIY